MSDLGLLSYYLGVQVNQKTGVTTVCQSTYALKILECTTEQLADILTKELGHVRFQELQQQLGVVQVRQG